MATLFAICGIAYDVLLGMSTHSRIRTLSIRDRLLLSIRLHLIDLR